MVVIRLIVGRLFGLLSRFITLVIAAVSTGMHHESVAHYAKVTVEAALFGAFTAIANWCNTVGQGH